MTAPVAKARSDPSPGAPSPDHPVRGPPGLFTELRRPSTCGTPRITNLFLRSANPSRFSRISPNSRISAGFSKFSFKAGLNSATKRGLSFGSVAMKAGSMVKLFSAGWQVPQVRPLPPNVSLKNRSLPFAMSWLKRSGGGEALLQPYSPTRAHMTKAVESSSRERIRPPFSSGATPSTLPVSVAPAPQWRDVPGSVELPLEHLFVLWVNRRETPRVKSARTRPLFAPVVLVLQIAFFLARGQDGRPPAWRAMLCILQGIFRNTRTRAYYRRNIRHRRAERQPPCAAF